MWFKKLRQRKLQSAIIFFIVLISSMLMTSSLVIMTSLNKPYQELMDDCNSPKIKVYPIILTKRK
jgi:putative ABC transport system permease protein